ncbi:hypothetical protein KCP77_11865 [Salmonella enterica subsp. enterica]|nr:hypothetical protein KCP77_11865 [Salmonella enterica subsp. enterica]
MWKQGRATVKFDVIPASELISALSKVRRRRVYAQVETLKRETQRAGAPQKRPEPLCFETSGGASKTAWLQKLAQRRFRRFSACCRVKIVRADPSVRAGMRNRQLFFSGCVVPGCLDRSILSLLKDEVVMCVIRGHGDHRGRSIIKPATGGNGFLTGLQNRRSAPLTCAGSDCSFGGNHTTAGHPARVKIRDGCLLTVVSRLP